MPRKENVAYLHFEVEQVFLLMREASFLSVEGVVIEDSTEGSLAFTLESIKTLIESDTDEGNPLISHDEELGSPLTGREESLDLIPIDFKESRSGVDSITT